MRIDKTQSTAGFCLRSVKWMLLGIVLGTFLLGGLQASAQYNTSIFGPNVYIFDNTISSTTINSTLNTLNTNAQFDTKRYAVLFKPGSYTGVSAEVGYYESVAGLGAIPSAVHMNTGNINSNQVDGSGHLTTNFWRSIENIQMTAPSGTTYQWGVSQAAPFRRMIVDSSTGLELANTSCGQTSGGFISNTVITYGVNPCSQQQWYTRNSSTGSWSNGVWNMVFSGVQGAPAANFPTNKNTVLATTPVSREKPFLYVDSSNNFYIFVPAVLTNWSGTTWANATGASTYSTGDEPGYTLPISSFYVATPASTLAQINNALASGLNLILTPGIYQYSGSINITNPNTIVLGLGFATIVPQSGTAAITVADVDGVQIAGLIIDAGPSLSPVLLQIGAYGAPRVSHAGNPITLNDIYFRVGGATVGSATTSLEIDSDNVILDDIWAWRADHGAGSIPIWTGNPGINGVVVNGDNVTALGLAVEHYEGVQVQWNGNGGETIFYQSELPYDVPSQGAWSDNGANGYPSYVVSNVVTSHAAYGLGVYSYFNQGIAIVEDNAITVPYTPGVSVTDAVSVFLSGSGQITATVDNVGTVAKSGSITSYVPFYGAPCSTNCPAEPANLEAYAIAPTQVNLAWTPNSTPGVYYTVYRSTSPGFTPSSSTQLATGVALPSYADGGVVASTTYYYLVTATTTAGTSPASQANVTTTQTNLGGAIATDITLIDAGCVSTACTPGLPTGWSYDNYYNSGATSSITHAITIPSSPAANYAPASVYQAYRKYSATPGFTYTIPGFTAGNVYVVDLHFAETYSGSSPTYRAFNIAINGTPVLSNFNIYVVTGGLYIATVQSFYAMADATGNITVALTNGTANNPLINGIEIGTPASSSAPAGLSAPTNLTAVIDSNNAQQVDLNWNASPSSEVVYEIFRSTTAGFTPSTSNLLTTTSNTSFSDIAPVTGMTYYYQVAANNGLFTSPYLQASATISVGPAASVAEIAGSGQTAQYGVEFNNSLKVLVQDAYGNLEPNTMVNFTGTGVSFPSGSTSETSSNGQATISAQPSAVGTLAVTASAPEAGISANFTETGTQAAQTINFAAPASPVTYGVAPITLSATGGASGNAVTFTVASGPGTIPTGSNILTITGAGTVVINANQAGNAIYAAAAPVQHSLTINAAALTVTANNASRATGAANPTFTASYSGFVNGETTAVLSGAPSLTATATTTSPAGLYPITAAQGTLTAANYNFTFVNGTLSVVAPPSVSLTQSATVTGSHNNGYTLTVTVNNTGAGPVSNVTLTGASLGSTSGSPLPQAGETIAAGSSAVFTVALPGSVGLDGAGVAEKYSGTYTGGTFSASIRSVTLP
jgi:hypothetical protein